MFWVGLLGFKLSMKGFLLDRISTCARACEGTPHPPYICMQYPYQFYFFKVLCMGKFATQFATLQVDPVRNPIDTLWGDVGYTLYIFNPGDSVLLYRYASDLSSQKIDNNNCLTICINNYII